MFDGIEAGDYFLNAVLADAPDRGGQYGYIAVSGPARTTVAVPGPPSTITLEPAYASIIRITGDDVVTINGDTEGCDFTDAGMGHLSYLQRNLEDLYETPLVVVARCGDGGAKAKWRVLLARSGWMSVSDDLRPCPSISVRTVDCSARAADATLGHVKVMLPEPFRSLEWRLVRGGKIPDLAIEIRHGALISVPAGRYRISVADRILRPKLRVPPVDVVAGSQTSVDVPSISDVAMLVAEVVYASGVVAQGVVWEAYTAEGKAIRVSSTSSVPNVMCLPATKMRLKYWVQHDQKHARYYDIDLSDKGSTASAVTLPMS
ncbi:MAG: hypothetical protein KDC98_20690 [Planctomycetes bacterium]|nr:hypothetical protein [Planctomycetota bacterium]